jgi:Ca2+-transporting ATPase
VIEMLGACSMLCVDKTGTLTENRMRVAGLTVDGTWKTVDGDLPELPQALGDLVVAAAHASARMSNDPMDNALQRTAARPATSSPMLQDRGRLRREYGLTAERPAVVRVWSDEAGSSIAFAKGAPEAILALVGMPAEERARVMEWVEDGAACGARVLAVATGEPGQGTLPDDPGRLPLSFIGLVSFVDPLRGSARNAVAAARAAGVDVAMITGDHPATALAVAREAGIAVADGVITGAEIARASEAELRSYARCVRVFARVRPDQKLRLVQAFKENGEIVAMTGDGVNDAPALKAAHIGLAMGRHGTDVAREAASIVLLDDDLGHLVEGIETGRRIFDNLRKAAIYIAAIHVPISGLALLPLIAHMPPLLFPLHVVLIEMVIDPVCAIAFESEPVEPDAMRQPPRDARDPLIGWSQLALAGTEGLLLLGACLATYAIALERLDVDTARTLAFLAFTSGNLAMIRILGTRKAALMWLFDKGHAAYWLLASLAIAVTMACVLVPALAALFRFAAPAPYDALIATAAGAGAVVLLDFAQLLPGMQRILGGAIASARRPETCARETALRI